MNPKRLTVAVIRGGTSTEHDVSLASGDSIADAVRHLGHDVVDVLIDRDGAWRTVDTMGLSAVIGVLQGVDVAIPALHGSRGEDGTVQGLLDCIDVPYVGSGVLSSATCLDKARTKLVLAAAGLHVAEGVVVRRTDEVAAAARRLSSAGLAGRLFVKPLRGGSSIGVGLVAAGEDVEEALAAAFESDDAALVEAEVVGREVDVAVLERPDGSVVCGPPLEIHPDPGEAFFTERAKYGAPGTRFVIPAPLDDATTRALESAAVTAFAALGCAGLARVDTFVTPAGIVINEVNTMPGFTAHSQFPQMWAAAGMPYPELVATLLSSALTRRRVACRR